MQIKEVAKELVGKHSIKITLWSAIIAIIYTVGVSSQITAAYEELKSQDEYLMTGFEHLKVAVEQNSEDIAENKANINQLNVNQAKILTQLENLTELVKEIRDDIRKGLVTNQ